MCSHQFRVFPKQNRFGDINVGWNCGLLDGIRPFFLDCWMGAGITVLTFFFSSIDIEMLNAREVEAILVRNGLYVKKSNSPETAVNRYTDDNGNEMYSVNVIVCDEDNMYLSKDCLIFPFHQLNELNQT